jgi:prepilin-type N-terminal cleavage/methylation domain-containing protein
MPLMRRAGFTLVEMLTALVLCGLVGLVLVRSTLSLQRIARASQEGVALQAALDGGLGFLAVELAEVGRGSAGEDLLRVAPDSLSYRGIRGTGIACRIDAAGVVVPLDRLRATRAPQPGRDSLLVYVGVDSLQLASDDWLALPLLGVAGTSCGGVPALRLLTVVDTNTTPLGGLPPFPPVRLFEAMQARIYPSLGAWWLGARSESARETIQPLAGPFTAAGAGFSFRDSLQLPTLVPGAVEAIELTLAGNWSGWPGGNASRPDSARRTLFPRNLSP